MGRLITEKKRLLFPFLTLILVSSLGCDGEEVRVEQVPKGIETIVSENPVEHVHHNHQHDTVQDESPWSLPDEWVQLDKEVSMRHATVLAKGDGFEPVEIAISVFPGDVGGELANVNRWRRQMGEAPLDASQLDENLTRFSETGHESYYARIAGDEGILLVAGIFVEDEERTWFVRSEVLPAVTADKLESLFIDFFKSFMQENQ